MELKATKLSTQGIRVYTKMDHNKIQEKTKKAQFNKLFLNKEDQH